MDAGYTRRKWETVITAIVFMALWDWLLCLCLGELKLSSPQVDFCVYSAWTEWQSPALDRTTFASLQCFLPAGVLLLAKQMVQHFAEAVQCVCVFSVVTAPQMKFQKVPNPARPCMTNKDAIPPPQRSARTCGNPSAEELAESKRANGTVNSEPVIGIISSAQCSPVVLAAWTSSSWRKCLLG